MEGASIFVRDRRIELEHVVLLLYGIYKDLGLVLGVLWINDLLPYVRCGTKILTFTF